MKKIAWISFFIILSGMLWVGFNRAPLPAIPEVGAEISEEVGLNFSINKMNYTSIELALAEKIEGKGLYVQFQMGKTWKSARPGLVIGGMQAQSGFKGGMRPADYLKDEKRKEHGKRDFSNFMKDKKGKAVKTYSFTQQLMAGRDGKQYMKMVYSGPAMAMIQVLDIPSPITLPVHISRKFLPKGIIQFQPGTCAYDPRIKGFYLPVEIR